MTQNEGRPPSTTGPGGQYDQWERRIKGQENRKFPPVFTIATQPNATEVDDGTLIFVSDAAPGSKMQYADGGVWVPMG